MFGHRYFLQLEGRTYFKRSSHGPFYQIGLNEDLALRALVAWQRRRMTLVIVAFAAAFVPSALFFSAALELETEAGLIAAAVLIGLGLAPFGLMLLIHLAFQSKVRKVLGHRHGEMEIGAADAETAQEAARNGEGKLAVLLFLGVAWLTLSTYMLVFAPGELPLRKTVVWFLNLGAAGLLTFLGGHGLFTLERKGMRASKQRAAREFSNDAPGDRR
ncbi:MAG TPA: hypothetical protein VD713_03490 [Sphingomonadales bacterium]|nr:hypothetical protein [Sphingomonadales bacterium]